MSMTVAFLITCALGAKENCVLFWANWGSNIIIYVGQFGNEHTNSGFWSG